MGVSECIIMGVPVPIGTGLFKLLQHTLPNATEKDKDGKIIDKNHVPIQPRIPMLESVRMELASESSQF